MAGTRPSVTGQQPSVGWEEQEMNRTAFKRSLPAGVGLAFGLVLCRPFSLVAAETPPTPEPGTLVIFAGTGKTGFSGDNGPAINARMSAVHGLAVDAVGNLYIAEFNNNRVRRVSPDGIITTFRSNLSSPTYLAFDAAGSLFISDSGNYRIRKVSPDRIMTTVAGGGHPASGNGDGGPATEAALVWPHGVTVDREGNLFIADWGNAAVPLRPRIRRVSPDGIITTVAGTGTQGYSGDGGPATEAMLGTPTGLATDAAGNLYIAETGTIYGGSGSRVRKVSPDGIITTVAGKGPSGSSGDGGPATDAWLNWPAGLVVDSAGNLFITEWLGHRVRKVSPDGIISTVAGGGARLPSLAGAPATAVGLGGVVGIAVDAAGNLYLGDSSHLGYGDRDWVFKVYGLAAPGLMGGQPFPEPDP
jgi:sugar lactone lactonase YvrE